MGGIRKITLEEYQRRTGRVPEWPFVWTPKTGTKIYCLHCGGHFLRGTEMVDAADGLLVCPNEGCDGSPMDWSAQPWR